MLDEAEHSLLSALVARGGESYSDDLYWYVGHRTGRLDLQVKVLPALTHFKELGFISVLSEPLPKKGRLVKIEPLGIQALHETPFPKQTEDASPNPIHLFSSYLREMGLTEKPPTPKPGFDPEKLRSLLDGVDACFKGLHFWQAPFNPAERDQI